MSVTPMQIETRLIELGRELDSAQTDLNNAEAAFHDAKAAFEIGSAKCLLDVAKSQASGGQKLNAGEKDALVTVQCEQLVLALAAAEALVKAARGNVSRIKTQVEIARSLGTSVRESMKI